MWAVKDAWEDLGPSAWVTHAGLLYWEGAVGVRSQAHVLQIPGHGLSAVPRISDLFAEKLQKSSDTKVKKRWMHKHIMFSHCFFLRLSNIYSKQTRLFLF